MALPCNFCTIFCVFSYFKFFRILNFLVFLLILNIFYFCIYIYHMISECVPVRPTVCLFLCFV